MTDYSLRIARSTPLKFTNPMKNETKGTCCGDCLILRKAPDFEAKHERSPHAGRMVVCDNPSCECHQLDTYQVGGAVEIGEDLDWPEPTSVEKKIEALLADFEERYRSFELSDEVDIKSRDKHIDFLRSALQEVARVAREEGRLPQQLNDKLCKCKCHGEFTFKSHGSCCFFEVGREAMRKELLAQVMAIKPVADISLRQGKWLIEQDEVEKLLSASCFRGV